MTQTQAIHCGCEIADKGMNYAPRFSFKICEYHRLNLKTPEEIQYHQREILNAYYDFPAQKESFWCFLSEHEQCLKELAIYGRAAKCNCDCHT